MSPERRYDEQEIAAIFKQAAQAQEEARQQMTAGEGLTLAELQEIGAAAGITPAFIERAAATLAHTGAPPPRRTQLGIPIGVARSVDVPGPLTDEDWNRLVVDLRETFQARGTIRQDGSFRQWTNGNLQALVEPTEAGFRLRLRTNRERGRSYIAGGLSFLAFGLLLTLLAAVKDPEPVIFLLASLMALSGLGLLGTAAVQQPRWATTRETQMEGIIARVLERARRQPALAARDGAATQVGARPLDEPEAAEDAATEQSPAVRRRMRS